MVNFIYKFTGLKSVRLVSFPKCLPFFFYGFKIIFSSLCQSKDKLYVCSDGQERTRVEAIDIRNKHKCFSHLHMHVISQDFDSPCLKNKKHWNSVYINNGEFSDILIQKLINHSYDLVSSGLPLKRRKILGL